MVVPVAQDYKLAEELVGNSLVVQDFANLSRAVWLHVAGFLWLGFAQAVCSISVALLLAEGPVEQGSILCEIGSREARIIAYRMTLVFYIMSSTTNLGGKASDKAFQVLLVVDLVHDITKASQVAFCGSLPIQGAYAHTVT